MVVVNNLDKGLQLGALGGTLGTHVAGHLYAHNECEYHGYRCRMDDCCVPVKTKHTHIQTREYFGPREPYKNILQKYLHATLRWVCYLLLLMSWDETYAQGSAGNTGNEGMAVGAVLLTVTQQNVPMSSRHNVRQFMQQITTATMCE